MKHNYSSLKKKENEKGKLLPKPDLKSQQYIVKCGDRSKKGEKRKNVNVSYFMHHSNMVINWFT